MVVTRRADPVTGSPIVRRRVLTGFRAGLASIAAALVGVVVVVTALVLGYLIAGLLIAAILVAIIVALLRGAFRQLRERAKMLRR